MKDTPMTNREIAHVLFNIATLLELASGNPYRIQAYRRAARGMLRLRTEARELVEGGKELPIPGLGKKLRAKIGQLIAGGRMAFYEELIAEQHPAIQALMTVPTVGPKTALRLFTELHLTSPEALLFAARRGRVRELWGFGERRERALAEAAARVVSATQPPLGPPPGGNQLPLPLIAA
jgi:DNA polymerase/3'-5' exonuclease PolX